MIRGILPAVALSMALAGAAFGQSLEARGVARIAIEQLHVQADIEQGVALVTVDQTFRNPGDRIAEGIYRFRLPEDAVVHSFSMWMEGREKHGQVLEAQHARRVYDSIVNAKRDPGLLEQVGWRDFKVSVFPIPARDTVRIRMQYAHVPQDDLGLQSIEFPLPVDAGPIGDLSVAVSVRGNRDLGVLDCPTHTDATVTRNGSEGDVSWSADGAVPAGPLVARWAPEQSGFDVSVLAHRPANEEEGYFVARIVPRLPASKPIPRDVVFVLDRSGSMNGPKLKHALAALDHGLTTLREGDRFGIISFSSSIAGPERFLSPATEQLVSRARRSLRDIQASGGTNIDGALARAAKLRDDEPGRLFQIVFLTDGDASVGERTPERIVARFREASGGRARLFAFGVGDGVKEFLLTQLARGSRGASVYLRDESELEVKLSSLFAKVRSPVLVSPRIEVEGVEVRLLEPRPLPDVYRGSAVILAGRYTGGGKATFHLTGRQGLDDVAVDVAVDLPTEAQERPHVAQMWARHRIARLLDDLRVHGQVAEIRSDIVRLGVEHQVVTPYTSFLVVEDGVDIGVHVPDDAESARVPEGPSGPRTGGPTAGGPSTGGSGYRGPAGEVPGDSREPSDPPRRPGDGGPRTPGGEGGGPEIGGGDTGGPDTRGPSGPSTGGGGGPAPRAERGPSPGDWVFWWAHNRDEIAAELVRERRAAEDGAWRGTVRTESVPVLTRLAIDEKGDFRVRASAIRALARMGATEIEPYLRDVALGTTADVQHRVVEEQAVLSLGWLPDPNDERRGVLLRCLHPSRGDRSFARPMAALALAYQAILDGRTGPDADPVVVQALLDTLQRRKRSQNVNCAALLALGLIRAESAVPDLFALLPMGGATGAQSTLADVEQVYVVRALGMVGVPGLADAATGGVGTEIVDALLALATEKRHKRPTNLRRDCFLALGRITPAAPRAVQLQVVHRLRSSDKQWRDVTMRQFAAASLGRIAADPRTDRKVVSAAIERLEQLITKRTGSKDQRAAYAAFALAHVARRRGDPALRASVVTTLIEATKGAQEPLVGALWLARGATGRADGASRAPSLGDARTEIEAYGSGWALSDPEAALAAFKSLLSHPVQDRILGSVARAAQLAGSPAICDELLAALERGIESENTASTLALTLGDCGDLATARGLIRVAGSRDGQVSDMVRGTACAALGRLAQRAELPGAELVSTDHNWRAYVPAIQEFLIWP